MAAQAGHAYLGAFLDALTVCPQTALAYAKCSPGTKICLVAHDEDHLLSLYKKARDENLPAALIYDSGHILLPHFDGGERLTAVGVGPATRETLRNITSKLKLA